MTENITILGLGEIGVSLARCLKSCGKSYMVNGWDVNRSALQTALRRKWIDGTAGDPAAAVRNAAALLLAVPADQERQVLEWIAPSLSGKTVVLLDFCPCKTAAAGLARQLLPNPENYLGVWAGVNPDVLRDLLREDKTAGADAFRGASLFIAAESETSETAIRFVTALAEDLGMKRMISEPAELDGMIAAAAQLPVLCAANLMTCLSRRTGWKDGKKAAGKDLAQVTLPLTVEVSPEAAVHSLVNNRENALRVLDEYVESLMVYRSALQRNDSDALRELMKTAGEARMQWLADISRPVSDGSVPAEKISAAENLRQSLFGGVIRKKTRK